MMTVIQWDEWTQDANMYSREASISVQVVEVEDDGSSIFSLDSVDSVSHYGCVHLDLSSAKRVVHMLSQWIKNVEGSV